MALTLVVPPLGIGTEVKIHLGEFLRFGEKWAHFWLSGEIIQNWLWATIFVQ
jgi:hypothetical protein